MRLARLKIRNNKYRPLCRFATGPRPLNAASPQAVPGGLLWLLWQRFCWTDTSRTDHFAELQHRKLTTSARLTIRPPGAAWGAGAKAPGGSTRTEHLADPQPQEPITLQILNVAKPSTLRIQPLSHPLIHAIKQQPNKQEHAGAKPDAGGLLAEQAEADQDSDHRDKCRGAKMLMLDGFSPQHQHRFVDADKCQQEQHDGGARQRADAAGRDQPDGDEAAKNNRHPRCLAPWVDAGER